MLFTLSDLGLICLVKKFAKSVFRFNGKFLQFQTLCTKDFLVEWKALLESFKVILTCVPHLATTTFCTVGRRVNKNYKKVIISAFKRCNVLFLTIIFFNKSLLSDQSGQHIS